MISVTPTTSTTYDERILLHQHNNTDEFNTIGNSIKYQEKYNIGKSNNQKNGNYDLNSNFINNNDGTTQLDQMET